MNDNTKNIFKRISLFIFLISLFINTNTANAQTSINRWGIGIYGGITRPSDDFGFHYFDSKNIERIGRISINHYLSPHFNASLSLANGDVSEYNTVISHSIMTTVRPVDLTIQYRLYTDNEVLVPYIFVGGGVLYADNFLSKDQYVFNIPHGVGLRYTPVPRVSFDFNVRQDAGFSDELDGYKAGNWNDFFLTYSAGIVFNFGKCKDSDNDGVPDNSDKCPGTPANVKVDASGCPIDIDGDGVPDYLDKCPATPGGLKVDGNGCPADADRDGVADYLDKCPNTPANAKVDASGCPLDSDGDGVADYLDKCPNTSANMKVDANGCPLDADADGVADYLDKCPDTAPGVKVDNTGCPADSDNDGVPDYLDVCPTIPGPASSKGCPEVKTEVKQLFQKALQGIKFETGKAVIKPVSYPILDAVVKVMVENPKYKLYIGGHTDDVGNAEANMTLSQNRAEAVATYLIAHGVDPTRVSAKGYGQSMPVDSNKTPAGRARNRRVELKVEFMQ